VRGEEATPLQVHTREIQSGPSGPAVGAFFDLDNTLVSGFSALVFLRDRVFSGRIGWRDLGDVAANAIGFQRGSVGFSALMAALGRLLEGSSERELAVAGERMFREQLAALVYPEARELVDAHLAAGHTVAITSAASRFQTEPVARDLGIPHVICTRFEVVRGRLTGRVAGQACFGEGKLDAARRFAERSDIDLDQSYFYTDGHEDLPLLEAVGFPRPTNPDRRLREAARERGWRCRQLALGAAPETGDTARTALLAGLLPVAAVATLGAAALATRTTLPLAWSVRGISALAQRVARLELEIEGSEQLETGEPALYVFNHASTIDALIVARVVPQPAALLLQGGEDASIAQLVASVASGAVILEPKGARIPRSDPALRALHRGVSLIAAPEDAPVATPRLAPFRLAPFRLALEAAAPVVPIAIENARDVLPTGGVSLRRARVRVRVLPPVSTRSWLPQTLRSEVARVRDRIAAVLAEEAELVSEESARAV
jgi:putative phosphoserine phosphatase/1-acylglycerol-3-phosphate O-acyltransferase